MCAIAAIYAYHYAAPEVDRGELSLIRDAMSRRGPDGKGEWISADGRVGLGHRRLAIIDLSERAAQPMFNKEKTVGVSFNGEIYNYRELRQRLEAKGKSFFSNSDTEVLLHLYEEKGDAMLGDLRGMFAFVLWDSQSKTMLLARDPYGIKPLYYADDGWTLRIASQVKALLQSPKVSKLKDPAGHAGFFLTGSVPEPFTLYQEIRQVPAGCYVRVDETGPSLPKKYFSIATTFGDSVNGSSQVSIEAALENSIRHHLVADVPVGIFLSSGVDSTVLAGLASSISSAPVRSITLAFQEFKGTPEDETVLADRTAKALGLDHRTRTLTAKEFDEDLDKVLNAMDQPSIDGVNTYFVSKAAYEIGLKVALSGVGADELFGGYPSFDQIPKLNRWLQLPSGIPFAGVALRKVIPPSVCKPKYKSILEYGGACEGAYLLKRGLFMPWELADILGKDFAKEGLKRLELIRLYGDVVGKAGTDSFSRVAALEASFYLRNQLLRDTDWAGMAHSLEIRTPYVDTELLKAIACPSNLSLVKKERKKVMAAALRSGLSEDVFRRPKTGFGVPVERWLETGNAQIQPKSHRSRRWAHAVYERIAG